MRHKQGPITINVRETVEVLLTSMTRTHQGKIKTSTNHYQCQGDSEWRSSYGLHCMTRTRQGETQTRTNYSTINVRETVEVLLTYMKKTPQGRIKTRTNQNHGQCLRDREGPRMVYGEDPKVRVQTKTRTDHNLEIPPLVY